MSEERDRDARICTLVAMRPLHDLPARERRRLGVLRGRGRPRTIAVAQADVYNDQIEQQRAEWIGAAPEVVVQADPRARAVDRLRAVEGALATEAAALAYEIIRVRRRGGDASVISSRRIDALSKLSACVLARARMFEPAVTPDTLEKVHRMFVGVVSAVAQETLPPEISRVLVEAIEGVGSAVLDGGER